MTCETRKRNNGFGGCSGKYRKLGKRSDGSDSGRNMKPVKLPNSMWIMAVMAKSNQRSRVVLLPVKKVVFLR